jgi:hypothetical protein
MAALEYRQSREDTRDLALFTSHVVSDNDADTIRRIWQEFRSGAHGELLKGQPIPFRDPAPKSDSGVGGNSAEEVFGVYVRDTIPLEDETGRIPPI